jgi:SsrA-binding protein
MNFLVKNRKATFNYEILERYVAGISLLGCEVKSILQGKCSLGEGWIQIKDGSAWLKQVHVAHYAHSKSFERDISETRERRLLLNKQEIKKIEKQSREKNISVVPLNIHYSDTKKIKVEIAVCKGKKTQDKREDIKKRDIDRDTKREMKKI